MKIDTITKKVISKNEIFADIVNYFIFDGKELVKPSDLKELDTSLKTKIKKENEIQRFRDIYQEVVIKTDSKNTYLLVGIENQSKVDNRMLLRCLEYNIMSYYKQLDDIENNGKNVKIKLKPVITFVLYFGRKKWTGPKELYDMLDLEFEEIKKFITNPKLYLISPNEINDKNINKFKSELRIILKYIKYSNDKNELKNVILSDDRFKKISRDSVELLNQVTKTEIIINDEDGDINMCKAIDDMKKEAREEGYKEGIESMSNAIDDMKKEAKEEGFKEAQAVMSNAIDDMKKEAREEGYKEGIESMSNAIDDMKKEAKAEGIEETKIKSAKELYKNGVSIEIISKSLNISLDRVKEIINN